MPPSLPEQSAPARVNPAVRALLHRIVDYAGLFPPARLPLDDAIHNYRHYRNEPESWMLGRFVLPVRSLADLTPYRSLFLEDVREEPPYLFSVLGTGGDTADAFLMAFGNDLSLIDTFNERYGARAAADAMEVPLPASLVGASTGDVLDFLGDVHRQLVRTGTAQLELFLEVPLDADARDAIPALAAACAEHNSQQALPARCPVGLKMRCGGLEPEAIPSVDAVADVIVACRNASVHFKATAGLHHPIRHDSTEMDAPMHGFINVFGAAVLAYEHDLSPQVVRAILTDDLADNFRFTKDRFGWRECMASLDTVEHVRTTRALSFGSCSFEEPVDDLRDLGLL